MPTQNLASIRQLRKPIRSLPGVERPEPQAMASVPAQQMPRRNLATPYQPQGMGSDDVSSRIASANAMGDMRSQANQAALAQFQQNAAARSVASRQYWGGQMQQGIQNSMNRNMTQHFGGVYGMQEPSPGLQGRRAYADDIIDGAIPGPRYGASVSDPRFAGMNSRFGAGAPLGSGTMAPVPQSYPVAQGGYPGAQASVPQPPMPLNGYGLRAGQGEMRLQPQVTPIQAEGMVNGTLGSYAGGGVLQRIGRRNVLIGNRKTGSPGERVNQSGPYGPMTVSNSSAPLQDVQQMVRAGQARATLNRQRQELAAAGMAGGNYADLLNQRHEQHLVARQARLDQRNYLNNMARFGLQPDQGALQKYAKAAPETVLGSITPQTVPTDTARENLALAGDLRGLLPQLGLDGYESLEGMPPEVLIGGFRHPAYHTISPQGRQAFNHTAQSWMALNPNNPWHGEMSAWMSGDHKRARQLMQQSIAAAEAQNASTGMGEMWP